MSLKDKFANNSSSQGTNGLAVRDSCWYAIGVLVGTIILSLWLMIGANDSYATDSSLTLTVSDNMISLNVAPTGGGAFAKSSAVTIGVSTSNYTGYTLSIAAQNSDNPTALINDDDNSKTLPSISSIIAEDAFKDPDSGSDYNNKWGYSPSSYCTGGDSNDCVSNEDFLPSPDTDGNILDITTIANNTAKEYELIVGARVNTATALGSYSNVYLISAVANAIPYSITYDSNTTDVVTGMPSNMSGSTYDNSVTLDAATPNRDGYGFVGWCTVAVADNSTCSGAKYNPGDIYPIDQTTANNDITLYAMWGVKYTVNFYSNPYQIDNTPLLVTINGRTFTKTNQGRVLAAYGDRISLNSSSRTYMAPILVSQSQLAVTYNTGGNYESTQVSSGSFDYDGVTYYRSSTGAWFSSGGTITLAVATKQYTDMEFIDMTQRIVIDSKADLVTQTFTYGISQNLQENPYTRAGYSFVGWSTTPTGDVLYTDGESVSNLTTSGSIDLYAIWSFTMQSVDNTMLGYLMRNSGDFTTLGDERDNNKYSITRIGDNYWMAQNLLITGILSAEKSNFTGSDVNISVSDLTVGNSYTEPRTHVGVDYENNATTWYNYAAATAGTITGDSNTATATADICPAGWKLPTKSEFESIAGSSYVSLFIVGGYYNGGQLVNIRNSAWWSTMASSEAYRYALQRNDGALSTYVADRVRRDDGRFIRCIFAN